MVTLPDALRLSSSASLALVGAGGKTSALFTLARQLQGASHPPACVLLAATTHLHVRQTLLADSHWMAERPEDLTGLESHLQGSVLVTGRIQGERTEGLNQSVLSWLYQIHKERNLPLLIEADGARQKPLKAPAAHEPPIPDFVENVVVVAGLGGLGRPLSEETVFRAGIFARLSGLEMGAPVSPAALSRVLTHPAGGLKNIPAGARRVALLNQADTPELQSTAAGMTPELLKTYDSVVIASLKPGEGSGQAVVYAVHEPVAAVILAAGESRRFGRPKQLLEWRGKAFVRHVAETALTAGLSPVVVVTGACAEQVESVLQDLPLLLCRNADWQSGQSASLQCGLRALPPQTGAVIFLLADQPQVPPTLLRALAERHRRELSPVLAPQVRGQRASPVLFDRQTFAALMELRGDVGGRALFSRFPPAYLPWHDESLLVDVDRPEDLEKLP